MHRLIFPLTFIRIVWWKDCKSQKDCRKSVTAFDSYHNLKYHEVAKIIDALSCSSPESNSGLHPVRGSSRNAALDPDSGGTSVAYHP